MKLRSIGAVLAGIVTGAALSLGLDAVLHATGFYPPWGEPVSSGPLVWATLYRTIFGIAGAYVAARLAPSNPMQHALALGFLGFLVCIAGAVATWDGGPAFGPHWYPVALIVTALPTAWAGGRLFEMQSTK